MTGDTIECFNCGHANPSWAQVCRSCGAPILPEAAREGRQSRSAGIFPTDQSSLVSMGAILGAIGLAIVIGLLASGLVPAAPIVADATPTPSASPSASAAPSTSAAPSASGSASAAPTTELIGTITYGYILDPTTHQITSESTTFGPGTRFSYSIQLTEPFGVSKLSEEVLRIGSDGKLAIVQARDQESLTVSPGLSIAGFSVRTNVLIAAWGAGDYVMREYRGSELIAEGRFTLTVL